ncbi:MAG: 16S rRNA (guanine(527)-N(7))-methyltransferase RsmG [Treponema sp.]|nr:16S rRNA (guanine(527)-N(7))-methyltransferase RsmG [Treponema sp.]
MITILEQGIITTVPDLDQSARATLVSKMEQYIKELILFNSAYNLTNTSDHDELVVRHILDSLAGYELIKKYIDEAAEKGSVVVGDIGSGGGLPGIPLAAAFLCAGNGADKVQFKLVERMEKRCSFLENCCGLLGLTNCEVLNLQAEQVEPDFFDLITFRAFRPLDEKMTKTLLRMVKKDGVLCAYKARLENIKEEMEGIKALVDSWEVCPLQVPGLEDSERNMVMITKPSLRA